MKTTLPFFVLIFTLFISIQAYTQLPDNFPGLTIEDHGGADVGNIFLSVSADVDGIGYYVFMLDNDGTVADYIELEEDYSYDFKMQPNGLLSYAQFIDHHTYTGGGNVVHKVMDQEMNEVASYQMKNGYIAEAHDFQILPNGHVLMFGYYMTQMDLSGIVEGGYPDAKVSGGIIQELDDEGNVVFQWRTWDHYSPEEYAWRRANRQTVSAFHLNTINLDVDDNIIFATPVFTKKLNRKTGEIMWHLGGNENEFNFIGVDSTIGVGQVTGHAFYRLENGNFLVYDNSARTGSNKNSEVHEYKLDEENKTAELIWTYAYPVDIAGWHRGNAYRTPNGNTVIGWGGASGDTIPTYTEIDSAGNILFEVYFDEPMLESYRAFKFPMGDWRVAQALVTELALGNTYELLQGDTLDTGVAVEITDMTGTGYNELNVETFDQAPKFPLFAGRDPMLTAQRVTLDPAYFYFSGKIYLDTEIFGINNPDDITIYFRATESTGEFIPLNTTYNFVTGKLIADFDLENTDKCEFAFGYNDFEAMVYAPVLTLPEDEATVYYSELQRLEWSPQGLFNYFMLQIATDQEFNTIVYENDSLVNTYYEFTPENNTSYYWRVKAYTVDYETILESDWSEVFVFQSTNAMISVFEPASEAKWQYGLDHFIQWEDNFADDVVIELLTDTTASVLDTTESDGAYKWSIPVDLPIGCRYRVRISSIEDPLVTAVSPYYFSVTDTTGDDGCTFNLDENNVLSGLNVYPVPASELIKLEFVAQSQSYTSIKLFDLEGRKVRELFSGYAHSGKNYHAFPVANLQNGIYFLHVTTNDKHLTRKIIISH